MGSRKKRPTHAGILVSSNVIIQSDWGHYLLKYVNKLWICHPDSNNISIGIHFFKVLVQIHYSRSPLPLVGVGA